MTLEGMFSITDWQETTEKTFEQGSKLNTAKVSQHYSGELTGTSEVFITCIIVLPVMLPSVALNTLTALLIIRLVDW